ncbi:cilia- and flagella-associated protein 299 [Drosophila kikkawai]|uniref:Cilia- and flagella-associated protein 299 n=1 Tax=Drosophila kikkawai TaxID=30033 RepID=A0A6P4IE57_DROKI|nr:cilia- and flagella-associated protein 299 [Drosophila kikkawai]
MAGTSPQGKSLDFSVLEYDNYNDYILSFGTVKDNRYLGNRNTTTIIVQLGYRTTKIPYTQEEYRKRVDIALEAIRPKALHSGLFGDGLSPTSTDPVLLGFKSRELLNLNKIISTIAFTSYISTDGSEISGYIDLDMSWRNCIRQALKHTDWTAVFAGRSRLKPMPHHLSYSNPRYNMVRYTDSDNFLVVHHHRFGLMFMHRGDHKMITVGGQTNLYTGNAKRSMVYSPKFGYVVFYDHVVRKKV